MKILFASFPWIGGLIKYLEIGFKNEGCITSNIVYNPAENLIRKLKLNQIKKLDQYLLKNEWEEYNKKVINKIESFKPDFFFVMNEGYIHTNTIKLIRNLGINTAVWIADNPFDSFRFTYLPINLKYYNYIFVADKIWIPSIRNIAPNSKLAKVTGGFSPDLFYACNPDEFTSQDYNNFECDVSFTGESYGLRAEGAYRVGVLDCLSDFNVKIWGDKGWNLRKSFNPIIEKGYMGERLSFENLRKLHQISTINLNMPAPQALTSFQPRVFEVAACKGFQIVDWREDFNDLFKEDELVSFKNIPDLIDKVEYFVKNPEERKPYIEKLFKKVTNNHTWDHRAKEIFDRISK